MKSEAFILAAS